MEWIYSGAVSCLSSGKNVLFQIFIVFGFEHVNIKREIENSIIVSDLGKTSRYNE